MEEKKIREDKKINKQEKEEEKVEEGEKVKKNMYKVSSCWKAISCHFNHNFSFAINETIIVRRDFWASFSMLKNVALMMTPEGMVSIKQAMSISYDQLNITG